jgi:tetratricopeptide (TPR) repeat protein
MTKTHEAESHVWILWRRISSGATLVWTAAAAIAGAWYGFRAITSWYWLLALFLLTATFILFSWSIKPINLDRSKTNAKPTWRMWAVLVLVSMVLWAIDAQHSIQRLALLVALSCASFMIGCLVGFLFTSYGQEKDTVGKVRDWLVGGITGITIAQASSIKSLLLYFALDSSTHEFALVSGTAIVYTGLGFFFMFIERELILNIWLAQSRAERGRLEGTEQAGRVTLRLLQALPASVLSGVHTVEDTVEDVEAQADLRKLLCSEDVKNFLEEAEEAAKAGTSIDWDVASKVANLRYYLIYFGEPQSREAAGELAGEWILRALNFNPLHADLSAKYADVLNLLDRPDEAVSILKRIERTPEAPAYVRQWLGYFLLEMEGQEDEAIRLSLEYHNQFPDESDTFFNIARAYARKYRYELEASEQGSLPESENRKEALNYLSKGLRAQPDYVEAFRTRWISDHAEKDDWKCFLNDPEFRKVVRLPPGTANTQTGAHP